MARIKLSGGQFEAPNTKLMGPVKWSHFYLYVILDIDRRRVVGWRLAAGGWRLAAGGWQVAGGTCGKRHPIQSPSPRAAAIGLEPMALQ